MASKKCKLEAEVSLGAIIQMRILADMSETEKNWKYFCGISLFFFTLKNCPQKREYLGEGSDMSFQALLILNS